MAAPGSRAPSQGVGRVFSIIGLFDRIAKSIRTPAGGEAGSLRALALPRVSGAWEMWRQGYGRCREMGREGCRKYFEKSLARVDGMGYDVPCREAWRHGGGWKAWAWARQVRVRVRVPKLSRRLPQNIPVQFAMPLLCFRPPFL